jgi:hypothetical protein
MTSFTKTHPAIRNERGCDADRLMLALISVLCAAGAALALTAIMMLP